MKTYLPHFRRQLDVAIADVAAYLASGSKRPLNNLILGPPGAGKSYIADLIRKSVALPVAGAASANGTTFLDVNFADVADYTGVQTMLKEIVKITAKPSVPFVLVDEFDVSLQGSSLIRFLINPMYGGSFMVGGPTPNKLEKCIFVFCGSYLRSRPILNAVSGGAAEIDVPSLYFDLMLHYRSTGSDVRYRQKREMFDSLCQAQALTSRTANHNAISYLLRLEKLQDFLSRINGFIIEIPDLAAPLEICKGMHFHVSDRAFKKRSQHTWSALALSKVEDFQSIFDYWMAADDRVTACAPYVPLIRYKRAIIRERLSRVRQWLNGSSLMPEEWSYLGMIWLRHGMRSLETICHAICDSKAKQPSSRPVVPPLDVSRSHVVEDYGGPTRLYAQLCELNTPAEVDKILEIE